MIDELLKVLMDRVRQNQLFNAQFRSPLPPSDPNDLSIEMRKIEDWNEHKLPYPMGDVQLPNESGLIDPLLWHLGNPKQSLRSKK